MRRSLATAEERLYAVSGYSALHCSHARLSRIVAPILVPKILAGQVKG